MFEDHLEKVSRAVEVACEGAYHRPMSEMIRQVVEVYVDAKMQRADISIALYKVAPDVGGPALVKRTGQRLRKAIESMLLTAPDLKLSPDRFAIDMMLSAMSGAMRSALGGRRLASDISQDARAPRAALPVLYGGCDGQGRLKKSLLWCLFGQKNASRELESVEETDW